MRTLGDVEYLPNGQWKIAAQPHVVARLKRIFPRALQERRELLLRSTTELCRDLVWVLERWPLRIRPEDRERMQKAADEHDRRAQLAFEIRTGAYTLPEIAMHHAPRDYQSVAAALLANQRSLLLADSLGLGKTVSALAAVALTKTAPICVVCPAHLQRQWALHFWKFLRIAAYIVPKRAVVLPRGRHPDALIISYAKLEAWRNAIAGNYRFVIFDEIQELRRGEGSFKYLAADHVSSEAEYRLGLSATPIHNYGDEFFPVLEVLTPGALGSREEFLREWCVPAGRHHAIEDVEAFRAYLEDSGLMLRRTRKDVGRELPPLSRIVQTVPHDVEPLQDVRSGAAELARIILKQSGVTSTQRLQAAGEFDMRLRQATGIAKAPHVAAFVRMLLESDDGPVVLVGWHRAVYQIWMEALEDFAPVMYTGSETPAQKARMVARFVGGLSRVLILSVRSGAGLDGLQHVCSRVVIGELDWAPAPIEQAIGRVHRDGMDVESQVECFFTVAEGGSDPIMMDVLGIKQDQLDGVLDPDAELRGGAIDPDRIRKMAMQYLGRKG